MLLELLLINKVTHFHLSVSLILFFVFDGSLKRVKENGGSPGIDGMTVDELPGFLKGNGLVISVMDLGQNAQHIKLIEDKRVLKLIRSFLNAGFMKNGLVSIFDQLFIPKSLKAI